MSKVSPKAEVIAPSAGGYERSAPPQTGVRSRTIGPALAAAGLACCAGGLWSAGVPAGVLLLLPGLTLLAIAAWYVRRRPHDGASSDREQIEDATWQLTDRAEHYRQLLDAQDEFVVRERADGRLVFANRAFCAAFCVAPADILGRPFRPKVLQAEAPPATGATPGTCKLELVESPAGPRWIAWDEHRVPNAFGGGELQRNGRDVTAERRQQAELRAARDSAQAASRAKSRFLATMSHEIRTPMNGILGMASLLRDSGLNGEQDSYARAMQGSARALLTLIDEILDFSKIEAGKIALQTRPFSISRCVDEALALVAPNALAKGLELSWTCDASVPGLVEGDEARVRQVILNLLSNAVKFTEAGSIRVTISSDDSSASPGMIAISVADTGIGFSAADGVRLFDEFEQGEQEQVRRQGGTGLGLAIARKLTRAMGGDIAALGRPSEGATFTARMRLPASAEDASIARVPAAARAPEPAQALHVLIAEDNAVNALLARRVIERTGGEAVVVTNGADAVAAMRAVLAGERPPFDLILMDVFMPVMDGLAATGAIRQLYASQGSAGSGPPPIIALTANAYQEDRERCLAAGMDDYLAKPFDVGHLRALLARWSERIGRRSSPAA